MYGDYTEVLFSVSPRDPFSDGIMAQLSVKGYDGFCENDAGFSAYIEASRYSSSIVDEILSDLPPEVKVGVQVSNIPPTNWNAAWEKNFNPILIDDTRCCIRASFHEPVPHVQYDIIIEPQMAFGTGHHDTTRLMVEKLLVTNVRGKSSLDIGCGTGILAILASKMGSFPVIALDTDDVACSSTLENALRNKVTNIIVNKGDAKILSNRYFDVILANINRNVLLAELDQYSVLLAKNGLLEMSGFFIEDIPVLLKKAETLGLHCTGRQHKNNWAMLSLTRIV